MAMIACQDQRTITGLGVAVSHVISRATNAANREENRPVVDSVLVRRLMLAFALFVFGVSSSVAQEAGTPERGPDDVILATTTSTQDSGLLDELVPLFNEQTGYSLKPIAVGSGAAMEMGERGEADVLLVHSPAAEEEFMEAGYGVNHHLVMYNDFVIVGPESDPAGVTIAATAIDAMRAIQTSESTFVSRGDDSGTHRLELSLWEQAGIEPEGSWYQESGTGMGETLNIADERDAYTITDSGTYLSLSDRLDLLILSEGDKALINIYHVIAVNPERYDTINTAGAQAFITFMLNPETQQVIGEFGTEEFGQPLFTPCANNSCGISPATPEASPTTG
jgi:tungstate transport system substrate-binding protein